MLLSLSIWLLACRATVDGPTPSIAPGTGEPSPTQSAGPTGTASTPSASLDPGITSQPSVQPSAGTTVDPAGSVTWQLVERGPFTSADVISDATLMAGAIVAVGSTETETGDGSGAAWYSLDGSNWQPADALPEAVNTSIEGVSNGPSGLVAVGFDYAGEALLPAIWRSADGRNWERVADSDLTRGQIGSIAGGGNGYVALGVDFEDGSSLIWTSADGADWSPVQVVPGVDFESVINGLEAVGQGYIAYGSAADGTARIWYSADGASWQTAIDFASTQESTVNDVAVGSERLVAVGAHYTGDTARTLVWTSTDGINWQRSDADLDGELIGTSAAGAGFFAVGAVPEANELRFSAGVWSSIDGIAWQRRPDEATFELARMIELFAAGPGLVAIGERSLDAAGEELAPAVWLGTP